MGFFDFVTGFFSFGEASGEDKSDDMIILVVEAGKVRL